MDAFDEDLSDGSSDESKPDKTFTKIKRGTTIKMKV